MIPVETVVFDLDGTLADVEHRRGLLSAEKPDWRLFNELMADDGPNDPVVSLYKTLWETARYNMVITTGRAERYRKTTELWLKQNEIPFSRIFMRRDGDFRADHLIKYEFLVEMRAMGWRVLFSVDDRQQVVEMWRRNGVTCLQCAEGDF